MDAQYLKETIGDVLSVGLAHTIQQAPPDYIAYLAQWLRAHVARRKQEQAEKTVLATQLANDAEVAAKEQKATEAAASKANAAVGARTSRLDAFKSFLSTAEQDDDPFFSGVVDHFRDVLEQEGGWSKGSISSYIGRVEDAGDAVKYLAATDKFILEQKLKKATGGVIWELFDDDEEADALEENDDDALADEDLDDEARARRAEKKRKELELKSVFVPNVLLGPKATNVHFFRLPRLGSFSAFRIRFPSVLADATLDEALEKEVEIDLLRKSEADERKRKADEDAENADEENPARSEEEPDEEGEDDEDLSPSARRRGAKGRPARGKKGNNSMDAGASGDEKAGPSSETPAAKVESDEEKAARLKGEEEKKAREEEEFLISQLNKQTRDYVLCFDSLACGKRFNDGQLALMQDFGKAFLAALVRMDRRAFKDERLRRAAMVANLKAIEEKTDEEKAEEAERIAEELEALGKPNTEDDVRYKYRTETLLTTHKQALLDYRTYLVFPRAPLAIFQAFLYLLEYKAEDLVDWEGKAQWKKMRNRINDDLFTRLKEYEPRASVGAAAAEAKDGAAPAKDKGAYNSVKAVSKLVQGIESEELKEKNPIAFELLSWIHDVFAVKKKARAEQKAAKEAEELARLEAQEREAEEKRKKEEEDEANRENDQENTNNRQDDQEDADEEDDS